jgi:hypothetical protein
MGRRKPSALHWLGGKRNPFGCIYENKNINSYTKTPLPREAHSAVSTTFWVRMSLTSCQAALPLDRRPCWPEASLLSLCLPPTRVKEWPAGTLYYSTVFTSVRAASCHPVVPVWWYKWSPRYLFVSILLTKWHMFGTIFPSLRFPICLMITFSGLCIRMLLGL